ncbi:MAG: VPLPA-CTERM sorting domain-containing protein [Planctomycetota bacterium]
MPRPEDALNGAWPDAAQFAASLCVTTEHEMETEIMTPFAQTAAHGPTWLAVAAAAAVSMVAPAEGLALTVQLERSFEITDAANDQQDADGDVEIFAGAAARSGELVDNGATAGEARSFTAVDPVTGELKVSAAVIADGTDTTNADPTERDRAFAAAGACLTETFTISGESEGLFTATFLFDGMFDVDAYASVTAGISITGLTLGTDDRDFRDDLETGGTLERLSIFATNAFGDPSVEIREGDAMFDEMLSAAVRVAPGDVIDVTWLLSTTVGGGLGFGVSGDLVALSADLQSSDFANTGHAGFSTSGVTATSSDPLTLSGGVTPIPVPAALPMFATALGALAAFRRRTRKTPD